MERRNGQQIMSNVVWKFAERILAQLVSLTVSVILARLLLPDDYGAIAMVMVFITIANVFVVEGIPSALIQKKNADKLDFSSVFYFNLVLSVLLYLIIFLLSDPIAKFYEMDVLRPVLRVLGIRIVVASINSVQHAYVARHMMFKKYFWSTLFGTILSGIVGIIMAYMGYGVWALVLQYMINTTVDTIVLFITVNWRPHRLFDIERIKLLFKFGWKMLFEGLANTFAGELRNLVIGKVYTSSDLAYYTKGQQFPATIVTNLTTSIGAVLFPAIANEQDNPKRVLNMLRKSARMSYFIIFPMLTGLAAIANPFVRYALTDKWIEVVPFLQIFCLLYAPTVGMIPRHQALNGTGRSDVFMIEHIFARLASFMLLFLTYRISVMAIVISGLISTAIQCVIVGYTSKRFNNYQYKDQINDIGRIVFGCMFMGIPVFLISYMDLSPLLLMIIQVVCGMILYYLYSKVMRIEELRVCEEYLSKLIGGRILQFHKDKEKRK